jgi:putative transposase
MTNAGPEQNVRARQIRSSQALLSTGLGSGRTTGLTPKRTSIRAPWQNGIAERWVGSCRRELLDHVIALNEVHLRRLITAYVRYYHNDRLHDSLEKDSPTPRQKEPKPLAATVISMPRVGGLHHRYSWREAA